MKLKLERYFKENKLSFYRPTIRVWRKNKKNEEAKTLREYVDGYIS